MVMVTHDSNDFPKTRKNTLISFAYSSKHRIAGLDNETRKCESASASERERKQREKAKERETQYYTTMKIGRKAY